MIDSMVSLVAPLHNDGAILAEFVREAHAVLHDSFTNFEVVLVDDGSTDDTAARVRPLLEAHDFVRYVRLSRQFGEEVAISVGLDSVIGDFVVVMLPNTDPPALVPRMVEIAREGVDVVYGIRERRRENGRAYGLGSRIFYWYIQRVLKLDIPADTTDFRCLSRPAVNAIAQIRDNQRSLRVFASYIGYTRRPFPYTPIDRGGRTRRPGFFHKVDQAVGLIVENSSHPLRFVSWVSMFASLMNVVYVAYVLAIYLFLPEVAPGWVTLSLQSALQFFLISVVLAAMAEYTGRILNRLGDRPPYYVLEEMNSSVLLRQDQRNVVARSEGDRREESRGVA